MVLRWEDFANLKSICTETLYIVRRWVSESRRLGNPNDGLVVPHAPRRGPRAAAMIILRGASATPLRAPSDSWPMHSASLNDTASLAQWTRRRTPNLKIVGSIPQEVRSETETETEMEAERVFLRDCVTA